MQSQGDIARLTAGPPGIPADRLAALREAYSKAMQDKELRAKIKKVGRPLDPAVGDEVLALVKQALDQKPEVIAVLKAALEKKDTTPPVKGTIVEWNGRSKIKLKLADGSERAAGVSGSRTKVMIGGKPAVREKLAVGLKCEVAGPAGGEASRIACD
jgi:hypothetical protein